MLNDDSTLNPLNTIVAKIQARVGQFLQCRQTLQALTASPDIVISSRAVGLLATQKTLEEQLSASLAKVEQIKAGVWSLSDVGTLTMFYANLNSHINDTASLLARSKGKESTPEWVAYLPWVGVMAIGGFVIAGLARKRSKR